MLIVRNIILGDVRTEFWQSHKVVSCSRRVDTIFVFVLIVVGVTESVFLN